MNPIERAISIIGSASGLARIIGVTAQTVCNYRDGRQIDAAYCPSIEQATRERGDVVTCEDLRPDVDWAVLRRSTAPATAHQPAQQEAANA